MLFNKNFSTVSILICLQFCAYVNGRYFWVDYDGLVPNDAVHGGLIGLQTITYVGQAIFIENGAGTQPVEIISGKDTVRAAYKENIYESSYIKVLCSDATLKWEDWAHANKNNSILGGIDFSGDSITNLYIGRSLYEDDLVIGKIVDHNNGRAEFIFVYGDTYVVKEDSFQILTY